MFSGCLCGRTGPRLLWTLKWRYLLDLSSTVNAAELRMRLSQCLRGCRRQLPWCELGCVFTQQGVNVSQRNQCLSPHVSREEHGSVCKPICFAIICSLSPNTHKLKCPDSAFIEPVLVRVLTSTTKQAVVVFHVFAGGQMLASMSFLL